MSHCLADLSEFNVGLAVALAVIIREKKHLQHDSRLTANATAYAEQHACPNFLDPGQATLQVDRTPSSNQPNIFEELSWDELAAVSHPKDTFSSWP